MKYDKAKFPKWILYVVSVWILAVGLSLMSSAGTSGTLSDGLTASGTSAFNWTLSANEITVTASPSSSTSCGSTSYSSRNDTLTLTSSSEAKLTVSVAVEGNGTVKLNNTEVKDGYQNTYELKANDTLTVYVSSGGDTNESTSLTLNYSYTKVGNEVSVSFQPIAGVSYKVNNQTVNTGAQSLKGDAADGFEVKSDDAHYILTGALLVDENGSMSTLNATAGRVYPTVSGTITPIFAYDQDGDGVAPFKVGASIYWDFDSAKTAAGNSGTIVLNDDYTLPAGNYTVPSGVTLLVPFDEANTVYKEYQKGYTVSNYVTPTFYRTLTLASGAKLNINGNMSIPAKAIVTTSGSKGGAPTGSVGHVKMESGSKITVKSGGNLYAYGFITGPAMSSFDSSSPTNSMIVVESGGKVCELLQVYDHRGGSQTFAMEHRVWPFSQYYLQNIEVPMTLYKGATEQAYNVIDAMMTYAVEVQFIGTGSGLFNLVGSNGEYLVKRYDGSSDRLIVDLYGTATVSSIEVLGMLKSQNFEFPLTNNITLNIHSGTTTIGQNIAVLPGTQIEVAENATVALSSGTSLFIYDGEQWGTYVYSGYYFIPAAYAPGRTYNRTKADLVDASILINGKVDASKGAVYTTAGGANIYSTGAGQIILPKLSDGTTYQMSIQDNPDTYDDIAITSAKLKNADGSFATTGKSEETSNTYTYTDGKWVCEKHSFDNGGNGVATKEPSCTEPGITTKTCTVCGHKETEEIPAVGHDYKEEEWKVDNDNKWHWHICNLCDQEVDKAEHFDEDTDLKCDACGAGVACEHPDKETKEENVVEATCTVGGSYDLVTYCTVCKEKTKTEKRTTPTIAHSLTKTEAVEATCSKPGNIAYWTCTVCGKYFSHSAGTDIYKIEENGWVTTVPHTPGDEATCTTAQICTVCETELVAILGHDYSEQFTTDKEATCTEAGSKSRHCSRCDSTTEVTEIPAIQHDWEVSYSVNDDETECTASGVCRNNPEHTVSATVEIKATVKDAATCTEDGTTIYSADFTGYDWAESQSTEVTVEKLGHIDEKNPETGWADHKCDRCSEILSECADGEDDGYLCDVCGLNLCKHETVEKHNCVQCGEELTECDDGEVKDFICEICGADMCPHDAGTKPIDAKAPTCVDDGYKAHYECITCEHKFSDEYATVPVTMEELKDPKTGKHTPGTDDGDCTTAILCTVCKAETTPANEKHTPGEDDGDCKTAVKCVNENCTKNAIEAKEHVAGVAVKENEVSATCAKEGSYDNVVYCVDCKTELNRETITVPATGEHNYVLVEWNESSKWRACGCGQKEDGSEQSREFTFVFKGYDDESDIELEGTYQYGSTVKVPTLVLRFETKFFHLDGNWAIDGRTIEQGSTFDWELIRQSLIESSDDTITIPGTYRVAVKPETIQMSATYGDSTDSNVFLTLSLFIMVDDGMSVRVILPQEIQIQGGQVEGVDGLYHYSLPLTAEQLNSSSATLTVQLGENDVMRYSKDISLALLTYAQKVDSFLGTGSLTAGLLNATMDYGKAVHACFGDNKTPLDNTMLETRINEKLEVPEGAITVSDMTVNNGYAGSSVVSFENAYVGVNANQAVYALAYDFSVNLPADATIITAGVILTDKIETFNTSEARNELIGRYYEGELKEGTDEGKNIYWSVIDNVPATELSVKYATVYVAYKLGETEQYAYSQTYRYGVVTYLNNQIYDIFTDATNAEIRKKSIEELTADEKQKLFLYDCLRDIADSVTTAFESSN